MKKTIIIAGVILLALVICSNYTCTFFQAYVKNAKSVGEIVPSSSYVAESITEIIKPDQAPKRIVELGAGTGAITKGILNRISDHDQVDLIEIEPLFCETLNKNFSHIKNINIYCGDFLKWNPPYQYDYIVSSLPLNSFPPELVSSLTTHMVEVAKPDAKLSFYEFMFLPTIRQWIMSGDELSNYRKTIGIITDFRTKYFSSASNVYMNLPPVTVYTLSINK